MTHFKALHYSTLASSKSRSMRNLGQDPTPDLPNADFKLIRARCSLSKYDVCRYANTTRRSVTYKLAYKAS